MKQKGLLLKKSFLWLLGIIFVVLYLYSDIIFDNYKISFASHMYKVLPWKTESINEKGPLFTDIEDSEYPSLYSAYMDEDGFSLWNNKVALGTGSSFAGIMYPLNYVYLLPIDAAVLLKTVLKFAIAFIGIFLLLKIYGCKNISAAIAGICYAFSATLVMWLGWSHSDVAAWAPIAFWIAEKMIVKCKIKYGIWMSIIIFLMLIAGMPTFVAYFMYLLGAYLLYRTIKEHWKDKRRIIYIFILFGCSVMLGVFLSFPYTGSLLNSVGENGYAASRANQAFFTLRFEYIRTMIFPYFCAGLPQHKNETTLYCGIFTVIVFPLGFVRTKECRLKLFYGISSIVIALLIFTHIFDKIYVRMPMINTSIKYRLITILMFTMTVLAGLSIDDIIRNPNYYKHKIYILAGLFIWGVVIISVASGKLLSMTNKELNNLEFYDPDSYSKALIMFFAVIILIGLYVILEKDILIVALVGFVIWDMTGFARDYLPLIDKESEIIPKATDSIQYMQDNTKNYERIIGLGLWECMANSNIYYGLADVRTHDFVATNPDMIDYYKSIYWNCYMSPTRIAFEKIGNYNLLKYLGTKYLVGENVTYSETYSSKRDLYDTTGELEAGTILRQQIDIRQHDLYALQLLVGTSGTKFTQTDEIKAYIVERYSGKKMAETTIKPADITDNSFIRIVFGKLNLNMYRKYDFVLVLPDNFREHLTLYKSAVSENANMLTVNKNKLSGHLIMKLEYLNECLNEVYFAEDGIVIAEFDEYSPKVSFAENIVVKDTYEEVLDYMKSEYRDNTVIITKDEHDDNIKPCKLNKNESIELLEYNNDYIKIKYTADVDRYIVINDYFNNGWKAYINGKETEVVKANYLLRAVEAQKGSEMILELKYKPSFAYITCIIALFGLILIIVFSITCERLQKIVDKKILNIEQLA